MKESLEELIANYTSGELPVVALVMAIVQHHLTPATLDLVLKSIPAGARADLEERLSNPEFPKLPMISSGVVEYPPAAAVEAAQLFRARRATSA